MLLDEKRYEVHQNPPALPINGFLYTPHLFLTAYVSDRFIE